MSKRVQTVYESESTWRSKPNEFLRKIDIGLTKVANKLLSTHVRIFVATPQGPKDTPGVFIRLSNGNGSCFARFNNLGEFQAFASWLSGISHEHTLIQALATATSIQEEYKQIYLKYKSADPDQETPTINPTPSVNP